MSLVYVIKCINTLNRYVIGFGEAILMFDRNNSLETFFQRTLNELQNSNVFRLLKLAHAWHERNPLFWTYIKPRALTVCFSLWNKMVESSFSNGEDFKGIRNIRFSLVGDM